MAIPCGETERHVLRHNFIKEGSRYACNEPGRDAENVQASGRCAGCSRRYPPLNDDRLRHGRRRRQQRLTEVIQQTASVVRDRCPLGDHGADPLLAPRDRWIAVIERLRQIG
jgi:hypothetical protein